MGLARKIKWVWTEKAERDFIAKYGRRKLTRKAGTDVLYDGKPLRSSIITAYRERGWIKSVDNETWTPEVRGARLSNDKWEEAKAKRWKLLAFWFSKKSTPSLQYVAEAMGLSDSEVLNRFVKRYGTEMVEKYGKLPYFCGGRGRHLSESWTKVMEAKV